VTGYFQQKIVFIRAGTPIALRIFVPAQFPIISDDAIIVATRLKLTAGFDDRASKKSGL
jgi:hypothetical protein